LLLPVSISSSRMLYVLSRREEGGKTFERGREERGKCRLLSPLGSRLAGLNILAGSTFAASRGMDIWLYVLFLIFFLGGMREGRP
jgi:hypothetical protein